jgi:CHAD domain-containing protein
MAFEFRIHESAEESVQRIARQELHGCISDLQEQQPNLHEAVHDFRKRCKKLRGLLRLIRPHLGDRYESYNTLFRNQARELSFLRDTQAQIEAITRLQQAQPEQSPALRLDLLREFLMASREQAVEDDEAIGARIDRLVSVVQRARTDVGKWRIPDEGFTALTPGLTATYRRARRAMRHAYADPTDHRFHEWRKHVKYHWHHATLLAPMHTQLMRPHVVLADDLAELLGQDHDYAVLRERLMSVESSKPFRQQRDQALSAIAEQQLKLRREMRSLGAYLHAESPSRLARRWQAYWQAWQSGSETEATHS